MALQSFSGYFFYPCRLVSKLEIISPDKHAAIIDKWLTLVLATYEAADFFKSRKDRFSNPVGANIAECLPRIFTVLISGDDLEEAALPLDTVVKIRAVQDFTPSRAVSFVYDLKAVVREVCAKNPKSPEAPEALAALDSRIDRLALMAFDIYMANRERLHQIRIRELQSGTHHLTDGSRCSAAIFRKQQREAR